MKVEHGKNISNPSTQESKEENQLLRLYHKKEKEKENEKVFETKRGTDNDVCR